MKALSLSVVDTTCPFVTKAQQYATKLIAEDYKVVMIEDAHHPEVIGVVAHTQGKAIVINSAAGQEKLRFIPRMGVVFQTTHSIGHVQEVVGALLKRGKEVRCSTRSAARRPRCRRRRSSWPLRWTRW